MQKQVFNYRSGGLAFVIGFLFLWAFGFGYGAWATPLTNFTINDRPATLQEAQTMQVVGIAISILVGILAMWLVLWTLNTRTEIDGEEIRCINWLGRVTLHSTSNRVMLIPDDSRPSGTKFMTEAGEIKVRKMMNGYGALVSLLNNARNGFQHWDQRARKAVTYHPPAMRFDYRWSIMHWFSFLWLGIIGFMLLLATGLVGPPSSGPPPALVVVLLLLFAIPGVWMQLTGWVERIEIDPTGIRWIDCLGRVRVTSTLEDIEDTDVNVSYGRNSRMETYRIFTDHGTIQATNSLQNYSALQREIDRILQSRV